MARKKVAEAYVELRADVSKLRTEMRAAHGTVKSGIASIMNTAKTMLGGLGLYMGARQILDFGRDIIAKAGAQEEADRELAQALKMIGKYSDESMADLKAFAAEIQRSTTYGDEFVESLMTMGAALGRASGDDLKDATKAALGWAEIIGVDAKAAMNMMARAMQGNFALWSRYTTDLAKYNTAQEKLNFLFKRGAEGFAIQEEKARSLSGQIKQLSNSWGDLKEKMGAAFAEGADLKQLLADMNDTTKHSGGIETLMKYLGKFVGADLRKAGFVGRALEDIENVARHGQYGAMRGLGKGGAGADDWLNPLAARDMAGLHGSFAPAAAAAAASASTSAVRATGVGMTASAALPGLGAGASFAIGVAKPASADLQAAQLAVLKNIDKNTGGGAVVQN